MWQIPSEILKRSAASSKVNPLVVCEAFNQGIFFGLLPGLYEIL